MTDRFKNVVIDFLNENINTYCGRKECLNSIYKNTVPQRDWDFDSLDMINFIMYIEMRYKISINDKELKPLISLGELCEMSELKTLK